MFQPHVTISVDLPPDAGREPADVLAGRLRLLWVLDEVREGRMTRVRAAELAGLALDAFLSEAAARGVDAIDYDLDDFRKELGELLVIVVADAPSRRRWRGHPQRK